MAKMKKVFVAMSGGVDSSVAALLVQQVGHDVTGCFIRGWYPKGIACSWREDRRDAMRVAIKLGIKFCTINLEKEYKRSVVDYMIREYKAGRTPNPDVMCNRDIKFGAFLKKAQELGADCIAMGHYVRKSNDKLQIAKDENKDQSYFLWTLTPEQVRCCLFPLGDMTKPEVRALAKIRGLHTAEKPDSQGVCFIGEFKMEDFLKRYIKPKKGKVVTVTGKVVGEHSGVQFYTIGQRKGFGRGGTGAPQYVIEKDLKKNLLTVGNRAEEEERYVKKVEIKKENWITDEPKVGRIYHARVRYRQPLQSCRVVGSVVTFITPQRAVTPGQSLVVYSGKTMVGGGVVHRSG